MRTKQHAQERPDTGEAPTLSVRISMLAWPKIKQGALPVFVDVEYSRSVLFSLARKGGCGGWFKVYACGAWHT